MLIAICLVIVAFVALSSGAVIAAGAALFALLNLLELGGRSLSAAHSIGLVILLMLLPAAARVAGSYFIRVGFDQRSLRTAETICVLSALYLLLQNSAVERLVLSGASNIGVELAASMAWLNLYLISLALGLLPIICFEIGTVCLGSIAAPRLRYLVTLFRPLTFVISLLLFFELLNRALLPRMLQIIYRGVV